MNMCIACAMMVHTKHFRELNPKWQVSNLFTVTTSVGINRCGAPNGGQPGSILYKREVL